jgi:hypothetical protein
MYKKKYLIETLRQPAERKGLTLLLDMIWAQSWKSGMAGKAEAIQRESLHWISLWNSFTPETVR